LVSAVPIGARGKLSRARLAVDPEAAKAAICMMPFMWPNLSAESVQLTRPDDDWKGWVEPNVPYKRPRWGVQPGPLLKLVVLVPMIFLLADWLKNGATSVMAVWLK
jgi:hypothetical protein